MCSAARLVKTVMTASQVIDTSTTQLTVHFCQAAARSPYCVSSLFSWVSRGASSRASGFQICTCFHDGIEAPSKFTIRAIAGGNYLCGRTLQSIDCWIIPDIQYPEMSVSCTSVSCQEWIPKTGLVHLLLFIAARKLHPVLSSNCSR